MMTTLLNKSIIDIVRDEGDRLAKDHCGFKFLMAHLGTFKDFKEGRIPFIRRKQGVNTKANFIELKELGKSDGEIHNMFVRFFTREYVLGSGGADPLPKLVQEEWEVFKNGHSIQKINVPGHTGGKVTYQFLKEEGNTDEDIETIFNTCRRKPEDMVEDSYRHKMYNEFQKMFMNFNVGKYNSGERDFRLSSHIEKFSKGYKPLQPTTFCEAVARMMTLVRLSHKESAANVQNLKTKQRKIAKKIANDKRCTKYNKIRNQMGVEKFNQKKAFDQAAKEKNAATKIMQDGMTMRTAKFVKWRTETEAGKKYDTFPKKEYVTPLHENLNYHNNSHTKHLGYTNRRGLANVVRRCLDNIHKYTNIMIKFTPDPGDASSQVYQYAPIYGQRRARANHPEPNLVISSFPFIGKQIHSQGSQRRSFYDRARPGS